MGLGLLLLVGAAPTALAQRVVCLTPGLYAWMQMLAPTDLVGSSELGSGQSLRGLTSLGPFHHLRLETLYRLRPQLVLAGDDNDARQIAQIQAFGVHVGARTLIFKTRSVQEFLESVEALGPALQAVPKIEEWLRQFRALRAVVPLELPFLVQVGWAPLVVAGRSALVSELLAWGGVRGLAVGVGAYPRLNLEELLRLRVSCLVVLGESPATVSVFGHTNHLLPPTLSGQGESLLQAGPDLLGQLPQVVAQLRAASNCQPRAASPILP